MIEFILSYSKTMVASSMLMSVTWILYLILNNPSIVDVAWVIGIALCGFIYFNMFPTHPSSLVIFTILIFWAIRLAGYLSFTRIIQNKIDPRYIKISKYFCSIESINFFIIFQVQAIILTLVASPLYLCFKAALSINIFFYFGLIIASIGIIGEIISDLQLYIFKRKHPRKLYDNGLWQYSRHPNYFFEIIIWVGLSITGIQTFAHILSFISPLTLVIIMLYGTIPLTERLMEQKYINFKEYKKQTSKLLPIVKKLPL
jgi:steroid 5-alpha reductase family enzyme